MLKNIKSKGIHIPPVAVRLLNNILSDHIRLLLLMY